MARPRGVAGSGRRFRSHERPPRRVDPDRGPARRWVAARWALRTALGRHTGVDPADDRARGRRRGKAAAIAESSTVRFNLSHSGELALIAISAGREVGIDVERTDPKRPEAFYRNWVRREARAKCTGTGISGAAGGGRSGSPTSTSGPGWAAALALRGPDAAPIRRFELEPDGAARAWLGRR